MDIAIKRVYEPASPEDGRRILVDRLWPRGVTKERLAADLWLKEVAPSTPLRRWYGHDPAKWKEFLRRYFAELDSAGPAIPDELLAGKGRLTLLYSARDPEHNQAVALREYLRSRPAGHGGRGRTARV